MRKRLSTLVPILLIAFTLTACGGGSSIAEESFIEGSGAVTNINLEDRKAAPALSGAAARGVDRSCRHARG